MTMQTLVFIFVIVRMFLLKSLEYIIRKKCFALHQLPGLYSFIFADRLAMKLKLFSLYA